MRIHIHIPCERLGPLEDLVPLTTLTRHTPEALGSNEIEEAVEGWGPGKDIVRS